MTDGGRRHVFSRIVLAVAAALALLSFGLSEAQALRATIAQAPDGRRAQIARVEYEGILACFAVSQPGSVTNRPPAAL